VSKRRKKQAAPVRHLSTAPLPARLMPGFSDLPLVFTDASRLRHGGLSAVLYADAAGEPLTFARSVPLTFARSVPLEGSNELELGAAVFGLEQADRLYPGMAFALFSDNLDAIRRLARAKALGSAQDAELGKRFPGQPLDAWLAQANLHWIKGHGTCRGNALADAQARAAAGA
jgi:ribonuclease HI